MSHSVEALPHQKYRKVVLRQPSLPLKHKQFSLLSTLRTSTQPETKTVTWDASLTDQRKAHKPGLRAAQNPSTHLKKKARRRGSLISKTSFMSSHNRQADTHQKIRPWLEECRSGVRQILKIVRMFDNGDYNERQVVGWVQNHCQNYKPIMVGPFFHRKELPTKPKTVIYGLEKEEDAVMEKLGRTWKESTNGPLRFIRVKQVRWLADFMEGLYLERNRINARQICDSIGGRMSDCFRVSAEEEAKAIPNPRKRPAELKNFLSELKDGEEKFGSMKVLTGFQKARFDLLNDVDKMLSTRLAAAAKRMPRRVQTAVRA